MYQYNAVRINSINSDSGVNSNIINDSGSNKKPKITAFDLYFIIHTFINGELHGSHRYRHLNSEEKILKFALDNNLILEFAKHNFTISYTIVLFPKLFDFIKLVYSKEKIFNDIITGINQYPPAEYSNITNEHLHNKVLSRIPESRLIKWYNSRLIKKESIIDYFKQKRLHTLLEF